MNMDCKECARCANQWTASQKSPMADIAGLSALKTLEAHILSCPNCRKAYAALLPLMKREAGLSPFMDDSATSERILTRVMQGIEGIDAFKPLAQPRHYSLFSRIILPLAAAAAIVCGFIFGIPALRNESMVEVRFSLEAPEASSVTLAADFNEWSGLEHPLSRSAQDGSWEICVRLKRGRAYRYNFVIDGQKWIADPRAQIIQDDGFGNQTSSLTI